ncbi:MgtC/SapB family protein [Pseudidiomarina sp. 1APR75-33.1]|uniref:MgtC/SapB family protein n=1 Tax=Pseudidiomarina terrestris TaxID=2820060 RepID=UPI00264F7969|nr:MgtC/SapB family protein [Pseudidiomarina sp. 1APR75-33.1]MDN7126222.1 MgtC/SapB family protein [Pseudidiomarina sp. 1APR75-33.1]
MELALLELAYALAVGLIIGLERGWSQRGRAEGQRFAGLRTFAVASLFGGVVTLLSQHLAAPPAYLIWLISFGCFSLLVIVAHLLEVRRDDDVGITTPTTLLLTFCLGAMCLVGQVEIAVPVAIVVALLLGLKPVLHGWVEALQQHELLAILQMLVISVVVLPLLPNTGYGPGDVINPYLIGWMVVLITGISFVGYFSIKLLGQARGLLVTGLFGGIASSTAVTLSMAHLGRQQSRSHGFLVAVILLAAGTMFPRMLIEVAIVNRELLPRVAAPLLSMTLVPLIGVLWLFWRGGRNGHHPRVKLKNPFDIITAVKFAGLLVIVLLLAHYAHQYFAASGVYAVAAVSGLTDVDAITLSMAKMAGASGNYSLELDVAARAIIIAASVNTLVKAALVVMLGHRSMWLITVCVSVLAVLAGWLTLLILG